MKKIGYSEKDRFVVGLVLVFASIPIALIMLNDTLTAYGSKIHEVVWTLPIPINILSGVTTIIGIYLLIIPSNQQTKGNKKQKENTV